MAKQTEDHLKGNGIEQRLEALFVDYLDKAREIVKEKFNNEHDIDSEVALSMHHMLHEYDKYRSRVE
jgi:hypothetical protein